MTEQPPDPELEQRESLANIERGGIPIAAERRLRGLGEQGGLFTSDLSVNEFALTHRLGLRPLTQVMGSCVHQVGWQYTPNAQYTWGRALYQELEVITEAWNEARRLALSRLSQEAQLAGADAVVGVHPRRGEHDWAADSVDYMVVGTAVCEPGAERRGDPVLSNLSVQDYWKLRQAGYQPRGLVAASSCFFVMRGAWAAQTQMMTFTRNQEISEYTQGIYAARETALSRLSDQARAADGEGVVAVGIDHSVQLQDMKTYRGGNTVRGLMVTFHTIGTAIRKTAEAAPYPPETVIELAN